MPRWAYYSFVVLSLFCGAISSAEPEPGSASRSNGLLSRVFTSEFGKDQLAAIPDRTPEKLAGMMSSDQKSSAKAQLDELEKTTKDSAELREIARGYFLLSDPSAVLRIVQRLRKLDPNDQEARDLAAGAFAKLGDSKHAVNEAAAALKANPNDENARKIALLEKKKIDPSKVHLPKDPFGSNALDGGASGSAGTAPTRYAGPIMQSAVIRPNDKTQVPGVSERGSSGNGQPVSPVWPWLGSLGVTALGLGWGLKNKLEDQNLRAPVLVTASGVLLLAASVAFPPAAPELAAAEGPNVVAGAASIGKVALGAAGTVVTTAGVKQALEHLVSRASPSDASTGRGHRRRLTTDRRGAIRELGVDPVKAGEEIHAAKDSANIPPNANCRFDLDTGEILHPTEDTVIGYLR